MVAVEGARHRHNLICMYLYIHILYQQCLVKVIRESVDKKGRLSESPNYRSRKFVVAPGLYESLIHPMGVVECRECVCSRKSQIGGSVLTLHHGVAIRKSLPAWVVSRDAD